MTMRNRYDQKVDLSNQIAFDNLTVLPDYTGLNFGMTMTAQELQVGDRAETGTEDITTMISDDPNWVAGGDDDFIGYISPAFPEIKNASLGIFNTTPTIDVTSDGANNIPPYPDFPVTIGTANDEIECDLSSVVVTFRHKGTINIQQSGAGALQFFKLKLWRLPAGLDGTVFSNWVQEYENQFYGLNQDGPVYFDVSATVPLSLEQGDFIYYGVFALNNDLSNITSFEYTQSKDSFFELLASSVCADTEATVSFIHETGSRIVEAITDRCLTMKSDYYGRTDSEPYAATADGCGSLRVLTSGLRLRNAAEPKHFLSLKEFFDSLKAIDNIGMGVEGSQLRVEPVQYFYQDTQIASHPSIPKASKDMQADLAYSIVKIGYKKWETENVNGLDEFNSNKEFRTSLKTISNTLDATADFIAGGYPIEHIRQQSFAVTGAADTKYDNDTFIVCVERDAYGVHVEQGNIENASGFFSPSTAYNWRIRPMYNLMRWWKSVAQSYANLVNSASKLFFQSGTGNLSASGELPAADPCKIETHALAENDNLAATDMAVGSTPIWKPETMTYNYPLSLRDYNTIKAAPNGYIYAQCGNGEYVKGFITNLVYRVAKGEADITLRLKWD